MRAAPAFTRGRHERLLVIGSAGGVVVGATVAGCVAGGASAVDGPLTGPVDRNQSGLSLPVGEVATWGAVVLTNTGPDLVEVDKVTRTGDALDAGAVDVVRQVELHRISQWQNGLIGLVRGNGHDVIPPGHRFPAAGATVSAGAARPSTVAVLVTVRSVKAGTWRVDEVKGDWTVAGQRRTMVTPSSLGICVQPQDEPCDPGTSPGWDD